MTLSEREGVLFLLRLIHHDTPTSLHWRCLKIGSIDLTAEKSLHMRCIMSSA